MNTGIWWFFLLLWQNLDSLVWSEVILVSYNRLISRQLLVSVLVMSSAVVMNSAEGFIMAHSSRWWSVMAGVSQWQSLSSRSHCIHSQEAANGGCSRSARCFLSVQFRTSAWGMVPPTEDGSSDLNRSNQDLSQECPGSSSGHSRARQIDNWDWPQYGATVWDWTKICSPEFYFWKI